MSNRTLFVVCCLVVGSFSATAAAEEAAAEKAVAEKAVAESESQEKTLSGISILGNSEAPKSLVIVPWKSSEIGDGIGVSNMLDERARPVDKDVFERELGYYEIRTAEALRPLTATDSEGRERDTNVPDERLASKQ